MWSVFRNYFAQIIIKVRKHTRMSVSPRKTFIFLIKKLSTFQFTCFWRFIEVVLYNLFIILCLFYKDREVNLLILCEWYIYRGNIYAVICFIMPCLCWIGHDVWNNYLKKGVMYVNYKNKNTNKSIRRIYKVHSLF